MWNSTCSDGWHSMPSISPPGEIDAAGARLMPGSSGGPSGPAGPSGPGEESGPSVDSDPHELAGQPPLLLPPESAKTSTRTTATTTTAPPPASHHVRDGAPRDEVGGFGTAALLFRASLLFFPLGMPSRA